MFMIFLFLPCVYTVIIVHIIISPLNSYLYIHWIVDFKSILLLLLHQITSNDTMSAVHSQSLSTALTVISTNIEGITASKASILSDMCKRERGHCMCLQETHRPTNFSRPRIAGMLLVYERPPPTTSMVLLFSSETT